MASSTDNGIHTNFLVDALDAQAFVEEIVTSAGASPANATIVANGLVLAHLRGVESHGINRTISYMSRVRKDVLDPRAEPKLTQITPVVAQVNAPESSNPSSAPPPPKLTPHKIDAHNGFGFPAAHPAMSSAIKAAQTHGIGLASVKHSNHFGMSAWLVRQALDVNMMSLVFTNSSPALPAWGSREKLLGVSSIACGAPAGKSPPIVLDMAPSVAAREKVYKVLRRGESIPEGWALDRAGRPTVDPARALEGMMLPMGGPKGSALAVMMDVFSGVFSGSAFAGGVIGPSDVSGPGNVGHLVVAIKPDLFMELDEFKERMDVLYQRLVGSEKMEGVDRIYFPGEIEHLMEEARLKDGVPYTRKEIEALNSEARKWGTAEIKVKDGSLMATL